MKNSLEQEMLTVRKFNRELLLAILDAQGLPKEERNALTNIMSLSRIKAALAVIEELYKVGYEPIYRSTVTDSMRSASWKENHDQLMKAMEYDNDMVQIARKNVTEAGFAGRIDVIEADAKDYLSYIDDDESFDMVFLDGPKAHYIYMLDDCVRLLKKGGILISDNVLYKGMTADDEHVIRRKITIVNRLRDYIDTLMKHPQLESVLLPLGDGVTISVKTQSDYDE